MTSAFDRYKATLSHERQIELEQLRGVCLREDNAVPKIKRVVKTQIVLHQPDPKVP